MLIVIMLNVIMLSVVILIVNMLIVIMLSVIMLCVIVVSVVILRVAMLNVVAPFKNHLANTQQPVSRAINMSFGQKSMCHLIGKSFSKLGWQNVKRSIVLGQKTGHHQLLNQL